MDKYVNKKGKETSGLLGEVVSVWSHGHDGFVISVSYYQLRRLALPQHPRSSLDGVIRTLGQVISSDPLRIDLMLHYSL